MRRGRKDWPGSGPVFGTGWEGSSAHQVFRDGPSYDSDDQDGHEDGEEDYEHGDYGEEDYAYGDEDEYGEYGDEDYDEDEPRRRAPWHFKVLAVGTVVYLGYRTYQGVSWVVHHI